MNTITFSVRGKPIPKGSKRAFIPKGSEQAIVVDANPKTKPWQTLIKMVAAEHAPPEPWTGPVALSLTFWMPKPAKVPKERLGWPITKPDCLKLGRAVEDALSGIIYKDDAQVVKLEVLKLYGSVGVHVRVQKITEEWRVNVSLTQGDEK